MLILNSMLQNISIRSLRTGQSLGKTTSFLINPANLKIEALKCNITNSKTELFLLNQDIRDISNNIIVINDYDVLSEADDLIRLKSLIDLDFTIIGKPVITKNGQRIGKVREFSIDNIGFYIQKLYVTQPLYKNLYGYQLVVDRGQIIEVTNSKIVIKDILQPTKIKAAIIPKSITGTI
ncbi:MAG TPA: PRC-barrel domain-containing protein [Candidatus Dormibacteraeota bacterium]|nr:PRC-barrel domain-containing protein [Candidatus Dormibacteraeota bacterium]